LTYKKVVI
jgi:hypothetical protein